MAQPAELSRVTVGDISVTYLPDGGGIVIPTALYPASDEAGWEHYEHLLDGEGKFITTIGGFYVETAGRRIIVDTGIGPQRLEFPGFGPFYGGRYLESVEQAGIDREEITDVFFTHLHLDHCGWTTIEVDGRRQLTFPNARHWANRTEWDFWYGGDDPTGPHPEHVQQPLAERIEWLPENDAVVPGITVRPTPGHTPGHVSLLLQSGDERLFLVADVLHGTMQLNQPEWSVAFDADAEQARATRDALYPELVRPDTLIAANHFSNQVFGSIVQENGRRRWQPLPG